MLKLTATDKNTICEAFKKGFYIPDVNSASRNVLGKIKLPDMGYTAIVFELLSANHMKMVKAYTIGYQEYINLEELNGKMLFYHGGYNNIEYEMLYNDFEESESVEYSSIFFEESVFWNEGIVIHDTMTCDMKEATRNIVEADLDARFYQRIGNFCFIGECFYHFEKSEITPEEYDEALKKLELKTPERVTRGYYKWNLERDVNCTEEEDFFISWKVDDMTYTVIGDYIEVKKGKKYFFLAKPRDLYTDEMADGTVMVFRNPKIKKI